MRTLESIIKNAPKDFLSSMSSKQEFEDMDEMLLFDKNNFYQLSNFHNEIPGYGLIEIVDEFGLKYSSTEAAYQAAKLSTENERLNFRFKGLTFMEMTPSQSKQAGNKKNLKISTNNWDTKKYFVMEFLLLQKFSYAYYRNVLAKTQNKTIVEFTTWGDQVWGVDTNLNGNNALGKLLMKVRKTK